MDTTAVFSKLLKAYLDPTISIIAQKGGSRSGKTWSTLQLLNIIAAKTKQPTLISVVSETLPHLKRGAIRDFKNMLLKDDVYSTAAWHDTDKTYSYNNGKIEFFSADQASKVMGPARDILFINECINVDFEVYRHLAIRTTGKIILDYNPEFEFWVDSKLAPRDDVRIIHSTYLDNDKLSARQIAELESNREIDPEFWTVYGLGETGSKEGLCIKKWDIVADMIPRSAWKEAYIGVDFGWTAPSAVMLVVLGEGGEVWIDQLGYGPNIDNPMIAEIIKGEGLQHLKVICDAAEPKSIKDLKGLGINAVGSKDKEITLGITIMNRYMKHYTARSVDSIDENRKYRYAKDKNGNYETKPIKKNGHAKDAERYVFLNEFSNISKGFDITVGSAS